MNIGKKILIGLTVFLIIFIGTFFVYTSNYYHADNVAIETASINGGINISNRNGALVFDPGKADTALIFYPGGKVEWRLL